MLKIEENKKFGFVTITRLDVDDEVKEQKQQLESVLKKYCAPNKKVLLIYDIRNLDKLIHYKHHHELNAITLKYSTRAESIRCAILTNNPVQTAHAILYTEQKSTENVTRKVFGTKQAAIDWITDSYE